MDHVVELDACLVGLGGVWKNYVYHFPVARGFMQWTIVHLEMVNILLAVRAFAVHWSHKKVLIKCDNEAVVCVLTNSRTRDAFLGACNVWQTAAWYDIELTYTHVLGKHNPVADLLSRWTGSPQDCAKLHRYVEKPLWLQLKIEMLHVDYEI